MHARGPCVCYTEEGLQAQHRPGMNLSTESNTNGRRQEDMCTRSVNATAAAVSRQVAMNQIVPGDSSHRQSLALRVV